MRYEIVSDCDEYSVWDNNEKRDLFPTKSTNRNYACKWGCDKTTAKKIADALNASEDCGRTNE